MATAPESMSLKKKIIIGVLIALTLGLATFFLLKRKAATGAGTAPAAPTDGRTGATASGTAAAPNVPTPPPAPGLTPPTAAAVTQAATGNVPDVPSSYRVNIFSNGMDWRTYAPIKALWAQRVGALTALYVPTASADQDAAFLMKAAKELGAMVANGTITFTPNITGAGRIGTIGWEALLIYGQFVKEAKANGITLNPVYTA